MALIGAAGSVRHSAVFYCRMLVMSGSQGLRRNLVRPGYVEPTLRIQAN